MEKLKEFEGFWFNPDTSEEIMRVIVNQYNQHTRLRFWYGDRFSGTSWEDENDVTGYIGRSTGTKPIPLLIHNQKSIGGGGLLTSAIVKIVNTKTHALLYYHPKFHQSIFFLEKTDDYSGEFDVFRGGKIGYYAKFKNKKSAQRYINFMNGIRMNK